MDKEDNNSSSLLASWGSRGEEQSFQQAGSNCYCLISASVSSSLTRRQAPPPCRYPGGTTGAVARCQPPPSVRLWPAAVNCCSVYRCWSVYSLSQDEFPLTAIIIFPQSQPNILDTSSVPSHAGFHLILTQHSEGGATATPTHFTDGDIEAQNCNLPRVKAPKRDAIWPLDTIG